MDYKIDLIPFQEKDGVKYKIIQITDIALHTSPKKPTPSVGKKVQKAFENNKPDRIYSNLEKPEVTGNGSITLDLLKMDPDFVKMVQNEEAQGYKVLISLPKSGVPIFAGKDTVEFMDSKNGKRLTRGIAKGKDKD